MDISIITDELSGDPETAFELGLEWGVSRFELRGVHDERVPRLSAHAHGASVVPCASSVSR